MDCGECSEGESGGGGKTGVAAVAAVAPLVVGTVELQCSPDMEPETGSDRPPGLG